MATPVRTALITGGNTGIGFETAKSLASQGYATVIACRDTTKGTTAKNKLKSLIPDAKVEAVYLDLANLETVRDFSKKALDGGRPLDVLVNNAGVMACPAMKTEDGFEYQLGVNHLGHFLLTNMLLPLMTSPERASRIVNVSSSAHMFGKMHFDDIMLEKDYEAWKAYGQSKLANVLFTYELARRISPNDNLTTNCLHPGVVATELSRYLLPDEMPWYMTALANIAKNFLKTPEQGAQTNIYLASSPDVENVSGKYFVDCCPQTSSKESYNEETARKLWDLSLHLTNFKPAV